MPDPNVPQDTENVEPGTINPVQPNQPAAPIDYEKKFAESTREAQLLVERNKTLEQQLADRNLTTEPTDSELRAAFPEWDQLSDFEKRMARDTAKATRLAGTAVATTRQLQEDRSWSTSVEIAVTSDPALQGKEQEFRQFASKPQYKGVAMELLVGAFLQKNGASAPSTPKPTPKPGLETGNGGPRTPDKPNLLTAEELAQLRKTDEKGYVAYIKAHPNAIEID